MQACRAANDGRGAGPGAAAVCGGPAKQEVTIHTTRRVPILPLIGLVAVLIVWSALVFVNFVYLDQGPSSVCILQRVSTSVGQPRPTPSMCGSTLVGLGVLIAVLIIAVIVVRATLHLSA